MENPLWRPLMGKSRKKKKKKTDRKLRFLNTEHNMEPNLFNLFEQCSDLNFQPFDITEYNFLIFNQILIRIITFITI